MTPKGKTDRNPRTRSTFIQGRAGLETGGGRKKEDVPYGIGTKGGGRPARRKWNALRAESMPGGQRKGVKKKSTYILILKLPMEGERDIIGGEREYEGWVLSSSRTGTNLCTKKDLPQNKAGRKN